MKVFALLGLLFSCTQNHCPELKDPKFKHNQVVRVSTGFYEGLIGIITDYDVQRYRINENVCKYNSYLVIYLSEPGITRVIQVIETDLESVKEK